jgi:hypothetical protein
MLTLHDENSWRPLDVPHDRSIEDLPPREISVPEQAVVTGQWQSITLPDTWKHHADYTNDNVHGWFRRRIEIPAEYKGKDFDLLPGCIDEVDEKFLIGRRICGTESFPPNCSTAWDVQRRYRVPTSLVHASDRPGGHSGKITLKAAADSLKSATLVLRTQ